MEFKQYWNEEIETMSPKEIDTLENKRLQKEIAWVYEKSSLYRDKLDRVGIKPEDIQTKADLTKIPFTTKDELRKSQETCAPYGGHLCVPIEDVVRVHGTSGTTGRFILTAFTRKDVINVAECGARSLWTAGMRPDDVVFHVFNYSVYVGGLTDHLSAEYLGATVVPIGVGNTKAFIELAAAMKPTCITSTPSYPKYVANKLANGYDLEPKDLGFKKGIFGGEPGAGIPATRKALEEQWGFKGRDGNYGLGEVIAIFGAECDEEAGMHFLGQGELIVELIDPDTGQVKKIEEGAEGEFVYTMINREATPLIRYRSRDYGKIISTNTCKCGRTGFRFKVIGRSDDMLWVRGVNVFPRAIESVVMSMKPKTTGEYQIIVEQEGGIDILPIRIEYDTCVKEEELLTLKEEIKEKFSTELRVTTNIILVPAGTMPTYEKKAKRVFKTYLGEAFQ